MTYRVILIILLTVCTSLEASAQTSQREYALKAGLMYYFALYSSQTTNQNTNNYIICSSSKSFVEIATQTLLQKKIEQRNVEVRYLQSLLENNTSCHIIFFSDEKSYTQYQTTLNNKPRSTLLIGEASNFINAGGHIKFIHIGGKIRFEINPEQLEISGIKISSKVIRLGKVKVRNKS